MLALKEILSLLKDERVLDDLKSGAEGAPKITKEQLEQLQYELEMYQTGLSSRPAAVLANKIDLEDGQEKLEHLRRALSDSQLEIIPVSGRTGLNLSTMLVNIKSLHDKSKGKT